MRRSVHSVLHRLGRYRALEAPSLRRSSPVHRYCASLNLLDATGDGTVLADSAMHLQAGHMLATAFQWRRSFTQHGSPCPHRIKSFSTLVCVRFLHYSLLHSGALDPHEPTSHCGSEFHKPSFPRCVSATGTLLTFSTALRG